MLRGNMAKLINVAEKAGVSITTASLVLSGKGRISDEVRRNVLDAANQLDYKRNKQVNNRNWVLLLNLDKENDHLSYFFNPIIRQLQLSAREKGFTLTIFPVSKTTTDETIFSELMEMKVSSVLSIHFVSLSLFKKLESMNIPCVVINNSSYQDELFTVCVDDFQGAYEGTMQLINAGHRNLAFFEYKRERLPSIMADRFFGFRKAVEEYKLSFAENGRVTVDISNNKELEHRISEFFININPNPTALFIHDDMLAVKVIHILNKLKIRVPEDISIIAPGDTLNYDQPETPRISTMKIDNKLMGNYATDMMLERLEKGIQVAHILKIKQTYIDRKSIRNIKNL